MISNQPSHTVRVQNAVWQTGLINEKGDFVLLCSGGRDSVCLLDAMAQLVERQRVLVLHINYGLREEAKADEYFVENLCQQLGIEYVVCHVNRAANESGNLQGWAREQRYRIASEYAACRSAAIVTAHTATDQVETFLYRLCVSPGRRALSAMQPKSGNILRPLLSVTREETTRYCEDRGLQWCDDATNTDEVYIRNRIRKRLLPVLGDIHPLAQQNILRTIDLAREEAAVLDQYVDKVIAGRDEIPIQELTELPRAISRLVVRQLAENQTGRLSPRAANRLEDLFHLQHGKLDLGEGARAVITKGKLSFQKTPEIKRHTEGNE